MSFASIKSAVTPLIVAAVTAGGPVTVRDRNQSEQLIPPLSQLPLVLLRDRPSAEKPLAVAYADRVWWLECTLWAAFPIDTDQSTYDIMREQLAQALRGHTLMGGAVSADPTFGTQVYVSGRELQQHDYPAIASGTGQVLRHTIVSCLVRESISFAAVA